MQLKHKKGNEVHAKHLHTHPDIKRANKESLGNLPKKKKGGIKTAGATARKKCQSSGKKVEGYCVHPVGT